LNLCSAQILAKYVDFFQKIASIFPLIYAYFKLILPADDIQIESIRLFS